MRFEKRLLRFTKRLGKLKIVNIPYQKLETLNTYSDFPLNVLSFLFMYLLK